MRMDALQVLGSFTPASTDGVAFAFLPRTTRTITRQGIVFNRVRYYEPFLEPLFDAGDRRVEVAYDPRDLSQLFPAPGP